MSSKLLPLESNPEVLNTYLKALGLQRPEVEFCDVLGLDPELLAMVPRPILAIILLFPTSKTLDEACATRCREQESELKAFVSKQRFFYMKQTIDNACGTVAVFHAIMNNVDFIGDVLKDSPVDCLLSAIKGNLPVDDALLDRVLSSVSDAHMNAALDGRSETNSIDVDTDLHFTCFVHIMDRCVELDGRNSAPLLHGVCSDNEGFVRAASEAIREKMSFDPDSFRFSIIALTNVVE